MESTDRWTTRKFYGASGQQLPDRDRAEDSASERKGEDVWNASKKLANDGQYIRIQSGSIHPVFERQVNFLYSLIVLRY